MRILTITYDLSRGGTQRAAQNFTVAYKEFGHDVSFLPIYEKGERESALLEKDIVVFNKCFENDSILDEVINWNPEVIHVHRAGEADPVFAKVLQTIKTKLPMIKVLETNVFSNTDWSDDSKLIDMHSHLSKWCFWKWTNNFPIWSKVPNAVVLPYMVIPGEFCRRDKIEIDDFKQRHNIPTNKFIFGRIAQKADAKWTLLDIDAFIHLSKKLTDIHLVLIGVSSQAEAYVRTINECQQTNITILDYLSGDKELSLAYNSFDVFIHSAKIGESFGMVFAESLLCETPVVTMATPTKDNSQHELIADDCGFVVKNLDSMKTAMEMLYNDEELRTRFGSNGRQYIKDNFIPDVLTQKALTIFETMLNNEKPRWPVILKERGLITEVSKSNILQLYNSALGSGSFKEKVFLLFPKLFTFLQGVYGKIRKRS